MYVEPNYPSKAALRRALAAGERIHVFQPGLGEIPTGEAQVSVEGPHYPQPHSWYGLVAIRDGIVTAVIQ